ncbi:hypothetical protein CONPUDRAFT_70690 [Coniophora puteana RWD-64-598 SS2]|uniref:Zinc finger C3HC4 RING-type domain-containing protein n=1 Tax=Coniophora puteana (strain RWD-64-598) TaxID=741705 RepID=A0A5M3MYR0_CONPW|nr:uncharacterized protein CONPUDRAFT_70690 [Coniophora puteana RWD-64-598 SS2]EIW83731.1 hypothetical protein CONPUDRAFT_70690 [Coniophora puteana RWD-64-598 SS2]
MSDLAYSHSLPSFRGENLSADGPLASLSGDAAWVLVGEDHAAGQLADNDVPVTVEALEDFEVVSKSIVTTHNSSNPSSDSVTLTEVSLRNCGHSMCHDCYLSMIYTATRDYVATRTNLILPHHQEGNPGPNVMNDIIAFSAHALRDAGLPQPELRCPCCRTCITVRPIPNITLRSMVEEAKSVVSKTTDM